MAQNINSPAIRTSKVQERWIFVPFFVNPWSDYKSLVFQQFFSDNTSCLSVKSLFTGTSYSENIFLKKFIHVF